MNVKTSKSDVARTMDVGTSGVSMPADQISHIEVESSNESTRNAHKARKKIERARFLVQRKIFLEDKIKGLQKKVKDVDEELVSMWQAGL